MLPKVGNPICLETPKPFRKSPKMPHVTFVLFPEFQMLAYVLATETLRVANKCAGRAVFSWQTLTATNAPIHASNGALVAPDALDWSSAPKPDLLLLCAGYHPLNHLTPRVRAYAARAATWDCVIGGVDTGTMVLAQLGLLDGHKAVLHYEAEAAFRESWPDIEIVDQIYCLNDNRLTAAGGTATGDAMLAWLARDVDEALTRATSTGMVHGLPRDSQTPQRHVQTADPVLLKMHHLMVENLSLPLSIQAICEELDQSPKQLRRRCIRRYKQTPSAYYRSRRLEAAHQLVVNSDHSLTEIALSCGYETLSSFSRMFRDHYGQPPQQVRMQSFQQSP